MGLLDALRRIEKIIRESAFKQIKKIKETWVELFEGGLALNMGFFFLCSKAFLRIIFCAIFRASNHQLVDKKN